VMPEMMTKRSDFQSMKNGVRLRGPFFLLSAKANGLDNARIGYTVTKKQGNSVQRNRMKRRLRALAWGEQTAFRSGLDYVFLASSDLLNAPFETLKLETSRRLADAGKKALSRQDLPIQPDRN
jgi:ribonuclease P protein component